MELIRNDTARSAYDNDNPNDSDSNTLHLLALLAGDSNNDTARSAYDTFHYDTLRYDSDTVLRTYDSQLLTNNS